jgi:hypothetical protein
MGADLSTEEVREYYRVLEIPEGAHGRLIDQAFRDLARVWHPDRFPQSGRLAEKATERMKAINEAYAFLRANWTQYPVSRFAATTNSPADEPTLRSGQPRTEPRSQRDDVPVPSEPSWEEPPGSHEQTTGRTVGWMLAGPFAILGAVLLIALGMSLTGDYMPPLRSDTESTVVRGTTPSVSPPNSPADFNKRDDPGSKVTPDVPPDSGTHRLPPPPVNPQSLANGWELARSRPASGGCRLTVRNAVDRDAVVQLVNTAT